MRADNENKDLFTLLNREERGREARKEVGKRIKDKIKGFFKKKRVEHFYTKKDKQKNIKDFFLKLVNQCPSLQIVFLCTQ